MADKKNDGIITGVTWVPTRFCKAIPEVEDPKVVQEAFHRLRMESFLGEENEDEVREHAKVDNDEQWEDIKDEVTGAYDEDDDSEVGDDIINPTDLVALTSRASDDPSPTVEMFVYDPASDSLYLHHDVDIPGTPLSLAWIGQWNGDISNIAVVGDREGGITCWNMDLRSAVRPILMLGGPVQVTSGKKSKKKTRIEMSPDGHQDAVLCVKWNQLVGHVLASSSADVSIHIWDLDTGSSTQKRVKSHCDSIQSIDWNPVEGPLLISAGFDSQVSIHDCRDEKLSTSFAIPSCPEQVVWTGRDTFVVTLTNGTVHAYDSRNTAEPVGTIKAHDANPIVAFSPHHTGLMASGGKDGFIKLWNLRGNQVCDPICSRRLGVGEVFGLAFHPNTPNMLLAGGSADKVLVYSIHEEIKNIFE